MAKYNRELAENSLIEFVRSSVFLVNQGVELWKAEADQIIASNTEDHEILENALTWMLDYAYHEGNLKEKYMELVNYYSKLDSEAAEFYRKEWESIEKDRE